MGFDFEFKEWMALDHNDGTFPPGYWAVAGRFRGEYGVYLGDHTQVVGFIPEGHISKMVASMKRWGDVEFAALVEGVRADVIALREGKEKLAVDLAGRRIRYDQHANPR